jgi:hypothetical protein
MSSAPAPMMNKREIMKATSKRADFKIAREVLMRLLR